MAQPPEVWPRAFRVFAERRKRHESLNADMRQELGRRKKLFQLGRIGDEAGLGWIAGIDLNGNWNRISPCTLDGCIDALGQPQGIHGMNRRKQLDGLIDFVRLQLADERESSALKVRQLLYLCGILLNAILPEAAQPGFVGGKNFPRMLSLGHCHQCDFVRTPPGPPTRRFYALPYYLHPP